MQTNESKDPDYYLPSWMKRQKKNTTEASEAEVTPLEDEDQSNLSLGSTDSLSALGDASTSKPIQPRTSQMSLQNPIQMLLQAVLTAHVKIQMKKCHLWKTTLMFKQTGARTMKKIFIDDH